MVLKNASTSISRAQKCLPLRSKIITDSSSCVSLPYSDGMCIFHAYFLQGNEYHSFVHGRIQAANRTISTKRHVPGTCLLIIALAGEGRIWSVQLTPRRVYDFIIYNTAYKKRRKNYHWSNKHHHGATGKYRERLSPYSAKGCPVM